MSTAVRVDFLTRPVLTDPTSRGQRLEWPPHPHRLFAAMVAAHYEAGVGRRETLEWLERQGPPEIAAPNLSMRSIHTVYVPVNDPIPSQKKAVLNAPRDRPLEDLRGRQPRVFPTGAFTDRSKRTVFYVWREVDGPPPDDLDAILHEVTRLGHSSSFVAASLADEAPAPTWVPAEDGETALRIPAPGTLDALDADHALRHQKVAERDRLRGKLRPPVWQPYGRPAPPLAPRGPWVDAWTWSIEPRARLSTWIHLAEAIRGTLVRGLPPDKASPILTGHSEGHHLAIVPLAHVHEHADGAVLGFAILAPELTAGDRRQLLVAMGGIHELWAGPVGRFDAARTTTAESRTTLRLATWTKPETTWATVTPMVFDRFPKPSLPAGRIVAETVERLGLPPLKTVQLSRTPWHPGVPSSGDVRVRRPTRPTRRPWCHVHLEWAEPVEGPIVLGAMRHFGLGLCRPLWDPSNGGST